MAFRLKGASKSEFTLLCNAMLRNSRSQQVRGVSVAWSVEVWAAKAARGPFMAGLWGCVGLRELRCETVRLGASNAFYRVQWQSCQCSAVQFHWQAVLWVCGCTVAVPVRGCEPDPECVFYYVVLVSVLPYTVLRYHTSESKCELSVCLRDVRSIVVFVEGSSIFAWGCMHA